jgi:serine/threonine protein phosphatase PrpC
MYVMKTAGLTDTGLSRSNNEDNFAFYTSLLIVADGMGGAVAGEIASSIAVNTISESLKDISYTTQIEVGNAVNQAIMESDKEIKKQTELNPALTGMGTTVVVALHFDTKLLIGNVGDSRAYLITDSSTGSESHSKVSSSSTDTTSQTVILDPADEEKKEETSSRISRITEDHSVVMELVRSGIIEEEEIRIHPLRNRITRCVGSLSNEEPDLTWHDINEGDVLILCSDGLWELVHEDLILAIVSSSENMENACKRLIDAANDAGGMDNITVIAAQFVKESS